MVGVSDLIPPAEEVPTSAAIRWKDGQRETLRYMDMPISFDCETYSFSVRGEGAAIEKRAVMWAWGMAFGESFYIGRTWKHFVDMCRSIVRYWHLSLHRRAIIWVHNLSYDFQFFRKWFEWEQIFALSSREVCYAVTKDGLEFRCSYILTGYSLEKVAEHLTSHTLAKLVGTVDYDVPRHPKTRLTKTEVDYLAHDCLIVTAHIAEQIEREGGIAKMPLTKTGYVRRDVRHACFRDDSKPAKEDWSRIRYKSYISQLWLDPFIYDSLHKAFQGGFTHANPLHSGEVCEDVASFDFASAYPAVMCSEYFPSTPPVMVDITSLPQFEEVISTYLCVFTVHIRGLKSKFQYDHYLSSSHCLLPKGSSYQLDNGRIVWADELITTMTSVDWDIFRACYYFDYDLEHIQITGMITWGKSYLPTPIIKKIIEYFQAKSLLKGVPGKEAELMSAKESLNSIYGMMVTNPLRPEVPYDLTTNDWGRVLEDGRTVLEVPLSEEARLEALSDYNGGRSRFLYYAWGVFVTAYCRRNLWRAIIHFGPDYVYSDTDSVKVMNAGDPAHRAHIEKHNEWIQGKIRKCLKWHGMDESLAEAKGKKLGIWEYEGTYTRFKTLGAKRYMVEHDTGRGGKAINITVSGVNKKTAVPYILARTAGPMRTTPEGGGDPFDFFQEGMVIPPGHAGKMIPHYGDDTITGKVRDRTGRIYDYEERSFVHLEPGGYSLSLGETYARYLDMLMKGLLDD